MKDIKVHTKKALILLLGMLMTVVARRGDHRRYRTAYACEGKHLNISCEAGRLIQLVRANYGRFSIAICNEHGSLDWSVNCASQPSAYQLIKEICAMKQTCVVTASSAIFGDPCPGTRKYLEVHYECVAESTTIPTTISSTTTTTTTNRPSIIIPVTFSFHPVFPLFPSTTTSTTTNTLSSKIQHFSSSSYLDTTVPSVGIKGAPPLVVGSEPPSKNPLNIYPNKADKTGHTFTSCPPTVSRNISWDRTMGGEVAIEPCPGGTVGRAKWYCIDSDTTVHWSDAAPDLSECQSPWAESLKSRIDGGDSVVSIAAELAVITSTKPLYGGDITQILTILHRLVSKMEDRVHVMNEKQRYHVILEMLHSAQSVASSLLEDFQRQAWRDLSSIQQRFAASTFIQRLERNTWLLANTHSFRERWSRVENNILVSIRLVKTWSISTVEFPLREEVEGTSWVPIHDVILLPAQALVGSGRNGRVEIVFVAYKNIQDFISLEDHFSVSTNFDDTQNSMVISKTQIINSRVLGASIDRYRMVRLHKPVTIILKHLKEENVTNPQCVYLEFSTRRWSPEGCWIRETNKSHTKCSCNHLTNFALIMDISPYKMEEDNKLTVEIVTIVGCGIAIFFLLVTFITLHLIRGVKDDRHVIQKNTCFCLVVSEVVFVGGINKVTSRIICGVVAGLLHYLFLTAFIWMLLESLQLLLTSLEKKNYNNSARRRWRLYYCSGYGLPLISVGVCAIINPHTYGTKSYCWLEINNYFIFGFVGPALFCVLVSFTLLCIVTAKVCRRIDRSITCKNKEQSKLVNLRSWSQHIVCILFLLSLTLGLAQWFLLCKTSLTGYLFTAVNSLQGLFIFILCLRNSKVRSELTKARCCSRCLSDCCRKSHNGQSNLYVHTNGQMTVPPPNAISGHHTLTQGFWRLIKEQQKENQADILDATTPDLPFIPMVGFRDHDHVVRDTSLRKNLGLCSELNGENGYFSSTLSTSRKYSNRKQELRNEATSSIYYFRSNHEYETFDQEFKINDYRVRYQVDSERDKEFNWLTASDIECENTPKHLSMKQHVSGPESTLPVALTSCTQPRNLSLFRDGYLRPYVAYNEINSPSDSECSFSSLVNDQSSLFLSSSPSSRHNSSSNSPSHEAGTKNQLLQSLPNLETYEEYGFSTFSNVLKFPSDNTALNSNLRVESATTQPMES